MKRWIFPGLALVAAIGPVQAQCPEYADLAQQRIDDATGQAKGAVSILWTEFEPIAILPTRPAAQPVVFRARAQGGPQSLRLSYDGGGTLSLLDNGVAPDTVAGDSIYTANLPTPEILARNTGARSGRPIIGQLRAIVGGVASDFALNIVGEVAPPDMANVPVVTRIGAPFNYRSTTHVVNYVDAAFHTDHDIAATVNRILPRIGDHYDFVNVLSAQRGYIENRHHSMIRNTTTGIGQPLANAGASFGSPARLKGYTNFPTLDFYDPQDRGYNHELGHQWINHLTGTLDDTFGAHWPIGPLAHDVMGTSGGGAQGIEISCRLLRQGQIVTGTGQSNTSTFGSYELYLMGLLPGSQLPITWQFTDQAAARALITQPNWCSGIINLATTDISLATITAANGVRVPAQGQRYFTSALLAVSSDRLLDDDEMRYLTWLAQRGDVDRSLPSPVGLTVDPGFNFHLATGGRARVDHRLAAVFRDTFD